MNREMKNDEFLKALLLENILKNKPAKINALLNEKGNAQIEIEGRRIKILALSMAIAGDVIKTLNVSVDDYCNMLKESINHETFGNDDDVTKAVNNVIKGTFGEERNENT